MARRPPRADIGSFQDRKWKESLARDAESSTDLAAAPFVTVGASGDTPNARALAGSSNVTVTDNGAGSSAVLDLTATGVSPGAYTYSSVTVDTKGRVTLAASGAAPYRPPVALVEMYLGTTAPSGYLLLDGKTIGNATSGATARANADVQTLYVHLWNTLSNTEAPVSTGRGASGAADFAASKTLTLISAAQRFPLGKAAAGTGSTLGGTGGTIDHTHATPAHAHTVAAHTHTTPAHSHSVNGHTHTVPAHYHGMGTGADLNITSSGTHGHGVLTAGGGAVPRLVNDALGTGAFNTSFIDITGSHTHPAGNIAGRIGLVTGGVDGNAAMTSGSGTSTTDTSGSGTSGSASPATDTSGGGTTDAKNPPFFTINFIIRYEV